MPKLFVCAGALRSVELIVPALSELQRHLLHLRNVDAFYLMPWIDKTSVREKAGF